MTTETMVPVIILEDSDDYPRWAQSVISLLEINNCEDAIKPEIQYTRQVIQDRLVALGMLPIEVSPAEIVKRTEQADEKQKDCRAKARGLIKSRVGSKNLQSIESMTAEQMWKDLRDRFQDVSPMTQMQVLTKMAIIKMSDYTDPTTYCNQFKIALDKANGVVPRKPETNGVLSPCGILNLKMAEGLLITFMIENLTEAYEPLASQIQKGWTDENTSLSAVCKDIIQYKIKSNPIPITTSLITAIGGKRKAPIGTCTQPECKRAKRTSH